MVFGVVSAGKDVYHHALATEADTKDQCGQVVSSPVCICCDMRMQDSK